MPISGDIHFGQAVLKDYSSILEIWLDGWRVANPHKDINPSHKVRFKENFLSRKEPFSFWVARESGKVLGWVSILPAFYHPVKATREAEISIYIDRQARNQGIGYQLTRYVLNAISGSEIETIWAFVGKGNMCSQRILKHAGMSICGSTSTRFILIKEQNNQKAQRNFLESADIPHFHG